MLIWWSPVRLGVRPRLVNRARPSSRRRFVNCCKRSATVRTCCSQTSSVVLTTPKSNKRRPLPASFHSAIILSISGTRLLRNQSQQHRTTVIRTSYGKCISIHLFKTVQHLIVRTSHTPSRPITDHLPVQLYLPKCFQTPLRHNKVEWKVWLNHVYVTFRPQVTFHNVFEAKLKLNFLPRDSLHKRGLCRCKMSVRPSVPSVTHQYCVETLNISLHFFYYWVTMPF